MFDGKFNPISLPWIIAFNKGSRQSSGGHNPPLIRLGCISTFNHFAFYGCEVFHEILHCGPISSQARILHAIGSPCLLND